jgi:peroxiredoxin
MVKEGDKLPAGTLWELPVQWSVGCPTGADSVAVPDAAKGKKIAIFGLPGAYTRTCSAKHLPGFVEQADALKKKGVDEIWCLSVNDAMVMAAWGKDNQAFGKVRMMGDGSALYTKALGLDTDLTARGMGVRCQRFSMLVEDGVVKKFNLEPAGQYGVSSAEVMLGELG